VPVIVAARATMSVRFAGDAPTLAPVERRRPSFAMTAID